MKIMKTFRILLTALATALALCWQTHALAQSSPALLWAKVSGPWGASSDGGFGAVAVDPTNPNIILVGCSVFGPGVFKSTDGGASWSAKNSGFDPNPLTGNHYPVSKIVISPSNPNVIYFGTAFDNPLSGATGEIFRSTDHGETWQRVDGQQTLGFYQVQGAICDLDVHPLNANVVYAGVAGQGVMKTSDGGVNWTVVYPASAAPNALDYYTFVRVLPTSPYTVLFSGFSDFVMDTIPGTPWLGNNLDTVPGTQGLMPFPLYLSTDSGSTWTPIGNLPQAAMLTDLQYEKASGNLYVSTIAYATPLFWPEPNFGIFKSSNGGSSWASINQATFASLDQLPFVALLASPSAANGGVFASGGFSTMFIGSTDAGSHWLNLDPCLLNAYIGRAALSGNKLFILTSIGIYAADASALFTTTSPSPSISSISPSALPTSNSPQLITIYGSNFKASGDANASSLIFRDPANNPYVRTPVNVTATSLQYNITVQQAVGTWTVVVTNASQSASNPKTFQVNAPSSTTGSLTVTLQPAGAISAGAQWQVDSGVYHNNGETVTGLTPGPHTVSCKTTAGYTAPAPNTIGITGGVVAADTETYTVVAPTTCTLTLNQGGGMGSISPSPVGSWNGSAYVYTAGSLVQLTANPNPGNHFVSWGGGLSGTTNPATVTMSTTKSISANFASGDPNMGTVVVTIQPPAAAAAGVKWGWNVNDFRDSGTSYTTWPGGYWIVLHTVDGWLGSSVKSITVTAGQTANYTATFTQDTTPGLLTVTLSPPDAVTAGAKWHVNGGAAQGNGATVSLPQGTNYTITFDSVAGWTAPPTRTAAVQRAQTTVVAGNYVPPVGKPVIVSLFPPVGAMGGGTLLTINGLNFTAPATVTIGGQVATNVSVTSATQITCLTPPSLAYGSASVVVQTATDGATNLNGFACGMKSGSNIDLVGSAGGSCFGVAVQGNYAYIGEGKNLLVMNVSTPSSPSQVGRVLLPGVVRGVALFGQYAYVADEDGGLQVVDISTPSAPVIRGFYPTTNSSDGVAIFGGRAYVADEGAGLKILDLGNPTMPSLLSSTSCGFAYSVLVKASANGVFAYLGTWGGVSVIDVSDPLSPLLRAQTAVGTYGVYSLAMSGNYVFATSQGDSAIHMVDVSNPSAPVDSTPGAGGYGSCSPYAISAANNLLYVASDVTSLGFLVFNISGATLTKIGQATGVTASGFNMCISGNTAYIGGRQSGFRIVDVSNPYSPGALASFSDGGMYGNYASVAVTGNTLCADVYPTAPGIFGDLKVFDVSQPSSPTLLAQLSGISENSQVIAQNGIVYLIGNGYDTLGLSIRIVSVRAPSSPALLATIPNSVLYTYGMALAGNMLYAVGATRNGGSEQPRFVAIDVSNPAVPVVVGTKDWTGLGNWEYARCLSVSGTKAVVGIAGDNNSLRILDLSNVSAPVEVGSMADVQAKNIKITADGHYAYVTDWQWPTSMRIVNLQNPGSPSVVTNITIGTSGASGLETVGNELYAATQNGLFVYDITNLAAPVLKRSYSTWHIYGMCVPDDSVGQRGNIYLADGDGGTVALREQDVESPKVYITNPTFSSTYTNTTPSVSLGGSSEDNVVVTRMIWSNSRGGGGEVSSPFDNWFVSGIRLLPGTNVLTVSAFDQAGNSGSDTLTVIFRTTNQNQTITFLGIADRTFGDGPITLVAAASSGLLVDFSVVSGPASVSNSVLTVTGAGVVTVQANQPGNSSFNPAPAVNASFNVAKADQSITFVSVSAKVASDAPFALSAAASSGLPVYFGVLSGPAALSNNVVTLLSAGTVSVCAWQPGNSNYSAAVTVVRSFAVGKIPQSIVFGPLSQQRAGDAPFPLAATASSGLLVSFSVAAGPATLTGTIVTLTGWGEVVLKATQSGNSTYAAATDVVQSLFVVPPDCTLANPQRMPNGTFQAVFYGVVGSNYTLQASTSLTNWGSLFSFACTNSPTPVVDTTATNYSLRFYRAVGQ